MEARRCDICNSFYVIRESEFVDMSGTDDAEVYFPLEHKMIHVCPKCTIKLREFMKAVKNGASIRYTDVLYLCDRKACGHKCSQECKHTSDVNHAINFELIGSAYFEKETDDVRHG